MKVLTANGIKALWLACLLAATPLSPAEPSGADLAVAFAGEVDRRLSVPIEEQVRYVQLLEDALARAGLSRLTMQHVLLVDRSPQVQAAFIYWSSAVGEWRFVGASPVSTGRPGTFDHFLTPLGVFEHSPVNMDFRAEGTRNEFGIRGYGLKGMRVFDFGWVMTERGWGAPGLTLMRLQMHATDPDILEKRLGQASSKGCIRIPASLNTFLDRYGLLDADYERAAAAGEHLWILRADREPTPWPGRYLVVVDSARAVRPIWSPSPIQGGAVQTKDVGACPGVSPR